MGEEVIECLSVPRLHSQLALTLSKNSSLRRRPSGSTRRTGREGDALAHPVARRSSPSGPGGRRSRCSGRGKAPGRVRPGVGGGGGGDGAACAGRRPRYCGRAAMHAGRRKAEWSQEEALRGLIRIRCWLIRIIVTSLPNMGINTRYLQAVARAGVRRGRDRILLRSSSTSLLLAIQHAALECRYKQNGSCGKGITREVETGRETEELTKG